MRSLNRSPENCSKRNGVIGLGLLSNHGPTTINIKVSHGVSQYEVFVPSSSSFGYLKSFICQKIGLRPERHKLFFRAIEKEDGEDLQTAGLTDNCEVLLVKSTACEQESPEEVQQTFVISKGEEAVAQVSKDVDKLAQRVSALQVLVDSGIKIDDHEIAYLTEMLMRQLLKLDGIEAEGEGKVQRKMEVRRVQSMVETLDVLKLRNSNAFRNTSKSLYVSTQQESIDRGCISANAFFPMASRFRSAVSSSASFPVPSSSKI